MLYDHSMRWVGGAIFLYLLASKSAIHFFVHALFMLLELRGRIAIAEPYAFVLTGSLAPVRGWDHSIPIDQW